MNEKEKFLTAEFSTVRTLVHDTDEVSAGQFNKYLIAWSEVVCKRTNELKKKYNNGFHATDITPPGCYPGMSLNENIDSLFAGYNNTIVAALFCESEYIKTHRNFEALSSIVEIEKTLIFDFLSENGLTEKFNNYVLKKVTKETM